LVRLAERYLFRWRRDAIGTRDGPRVETAKRPVEVHAGYTSSASVSMAVDSKMEVNRKMTRKKWRETEIRR
jgi:hypothetical protein